MVPERFDFPNAAGELLAARLERPSQEPIAYALFAHCFTCSKDSLAARRISEALTARGIAVLRFDFTGLGSSEGDFANTHFSSNVADVVAAADHLRKTRRAPALLIGHRGLAEIDRAAIRQGEGQARGRQAFVAIEQVLTVILPHNRAALRDEQMPARGGVIDMRGHPGSKVPFHV